MKEPFLVKFVVLNNFTYLNQEQQMRLPLKKINQICTITKERFIIFLQKKNFLQSSELENIHFEFFDRSQDKFIEEKQVFDFHNNLFFFPQEFFGKPEILETKLIFEVNYWKIKGLEMDLQDYEKIKQQLIDEQQELRKELDDQKSQFQEMKKYLNDMYDLAKEQIKLKKNEELKKRQREEVDIVIIYSSPLIQVDDNNKISNAQFIDYESEIRNIEVEIKTSDKEIEYNVLLATRDNLDEAMNCNPQIIHLIINGDNDPNSGYYFQLQDGGVTDKLPLEGLIQQMQFHQRKFKRLKLICISSIIAKDIIKFPQSNDNNPYFIENVQNFASVTFVGQTKLFGCNDKFGNEFWKYFYNQLFQKKTFEDSYNYAKKEVEKFFNQNLKEQNQTNVQICCCFHEHNEECLKDPSKIGYQDSHKQHLKCSQQRFKHNYCKLPYLSQEQCDKGCLGQIYHNNESEECKIISGNCKLYDERFEKISDRFNQRNNLNQRSDILKFDIPFDLQIESINNDQEEKNVCCCFEYHVFQHRLIDNAPIKQHKYKQHLIYQKFVISSSKNNFKEQNQLDFQQLSNKKEITYLQINKQIIIIHSKDCSKDDNSLLEKILKYFKKYCKTKNLNHLTYPKQYEVYMTIKKQNQKSNIIHIPQTFQEMTLNVNQIFEKHLQDDKTFKIIIIKDIDKYCQDKQFETFYTDLLIKFLSKENIVIIFEVSFKNITCLNKSKYEDFFQLIDFDGIKEQLGKNNM